MPLRSLLLDQVFSSLRTGVLTVNHRHQVGLLNGAARAVLGLNAGVVEGHPINRVLSNHPHLIDFLTDALRVRTVLDRAEVQLCGYAGQPMMIGITATPLTDQDGAYLGVVAMFKDLAKIERSEEQHQLKERLAALGQMAAGLAHEMRNPLASIKITVGLLRKSVSPDSDLDRKLRAILGDVQRLNQSVTDCLAFARPIRFEPRPVRVEDILEKVLGQVVSLEHTYPFQILRRFAADTPPTWIDPQQMEIVFFNVINNAIDAVRHRHGTIVITTALESAGREADQERLTITVSDDGEGIPVDRLPKVFMPFFTTKGKGSGLGLANAKKIIEQSQGTIEVRSEVGKGTTFTIRMPVLTAPLAAAA